MIVGIRDTYEFLLGQWRIERTLTDHRLHQTGLLSGTATVMPRRRADPEWAEDQDVAHYHEVGELHLGEYRGTAHRRLRFVRRKHGAVGVTFEDGRAFVTCDLRAGSCCAVHRCGDDHYEVAWKVYTDDLIVEEWRVRGPHKDYEARSVLRKVRRSGCG